MKQLLIVKSSAALNGGAAAPKDLSGMAAGAIGFFALNDYSTWLSAAPTSEFGIALGRGNNSPAFVIPEVDVNTLKVTETTYAAGAAYVGTITVPTPTAGNYYTLVLVKLGTGINGERNKWSQSVYVPTGTTMTANEVGDGWKLVPSDDLLGTTVTVTTNGVKTVGDKAYIQDLARQCAGNKGFTNTDLESQHIYPGYPEEVENVNYNIFNLRFATGRASGKQTDERIYQYVHIAVPTTSAALSTIRTILTQPVLPNAAKSEG